MRMKIKAFSISIILTLVLVLAALNSAFPFDRVKFAAIAEPHIAIPQQKGVKDGYKLGLKTVMLTQSAVNEINKIPDLNFVLVAGDLTQDAEPWNIDILRRILDQLEVPYFVVLGNHDLSRVPHEQKDQPVTLSKYTVANAFIGKSGGMSPGSTYYAHEVAPNLVLIGLDTPRDQGQVYVPKAKLNDYGGQVGPAQLRWLKKTLKANQGKSVIVLTHHSATPWHEADKTKEHNYYRWFWMDNGNEVAALLGKNKVKAVFSGHRHISTRYKKIHGVYHFITPPVSTYPMRYVVYEMTPNDLTWEVKDIPASSEVWGLAKKNFLASKWWRCPDHPDTPEGNKKYLEFYESPTTMKGKVTFR